MAKTYETVNGKLMETQTITVEVDNNKIANLKHLKVNYQENIDILKAKLDDVKDQLAALKTAGATVD